MHKLFLKPQQASKAEKELERGQHIVLFFMETCPHCIAMKPEWNKFVSKYGKSRSIITVEREAMPPKFQSEIYSFPTIVLIKDGNIIDKHQGERSADSFNIFSTKISKKSLKGASRRKLSKKTKRTIKK